MEDIIPYLFILVRKDLPLSIHKLVEQTTHGVLHCAHKGISACMGGNGLGQFSQRCSWYRSWTQNNMPIYLLGCDHEGHIWETHHDVINIDQDIPIYIMKDKGFVHGQETPTCLIIGPCDRTPITSVIMKFQQY